MDDSEGYHPELQSDLRHEATAEAKRDTWLEGGVERFRGDGELCEALGSLARHGDSRRCLLLLESILEMPAPADELFALLRLNSRTEGNPGRYAQGSGDAASPGGPRGQIASQIRLPYPQPDPQPY